MLNTISYDSLVMYDSHLREPRHADSRIHVFVACTSGSGFTELICWYAIHLAHHRLGLDLDIGLSQKCPARLTLPQP